MNSVGLITVSARDTRSGLDDAYSFDGGETWQAESTFTLTEGTLNAWDIHVRDKAGNIAVYDSDYVYDLSDPDTTAPVIDSVEIVYGGDSVNGYYPSAKLVITAHDDDSGIRTTNAYAFSGFTYPEWGDTYEYIFTTTSNIYHNGVKVRDNAGNIAAYSDSWETFKPEMMDITGPSVNTIKLYFDDVWYGYNICKQESYEIGVTDSQCGMPADAYAIALQGTDPGDVEWQESTVFILNGFIPEDGSSATIKLVIYTRDLLGNIGYKNMSWAYASYIDDKEPTIFGVHMADIDEETGDVTVRVIARDLRRGNLQASGLADEAYSFDGGATWPEGAESVTIDGVTYQVDAQIAQAMLGIEGLVENLDENGEPDINRIIMAYLAYEELTEEQKLFVANYDELEVYMQALAEENHTDESSGIGASGLEWYIEVSGTVKPLESEEAAALQETVGQNTPLMMYDISLYDIVNGAEYEPGEPVTVRLPAPDMAGYAGVVIVHQKDDGTIEYIEATIEGDELVFVATSFSSYGVVGYVGQSPLVLAGGTNLGWLIWLGIGVVLLAAFIALLVIRKNKALADE